MAETKPKLLIVEDDEGLQAQLKWAYEDFDVILADTRETAVAAVRAEEPAVVTLDLGLPRSFRSLGCGPHLIALYPQAVVAVVHVPRLLRKDVEAAMATHRLGVAWGAMW